MHRNAVFFRGLHAVFGIQKIQKYSDLLQQSVQQAALQHSNSRSTEKERKKKKGGGKGEKKKKERESLLVWRYTFFGIRNKWSTTERQPLVYSILRKKKKGRGKYTVYSRPGVCRIRIFFGLRPAYQYYVVRSYVSVELGLYCRQCTVVPLIKESLQH